MRRSWHLTLGFQACSGGEPKPIPGLQGRKQGAERLKSWMKGAEFRRRLNLDSVDARFRCSPGWPANSPEPMKLSPREFPQKRPPWATSSSKVPVSITRSPCRTPGFSWRCGWWRARCAITKVVRPFITSSRAALNLGLGYPRRARRSPRPRIRIGGFFRSGARDRQPLPLAAGQHAGHAPPAVGFRISGRRAPMNSSACAARAAAIPHFLFGGVGLCRPARLSAIERFETAALPGTPRRYSAAAPSG